MRRFVVLHIGGLCVVTVLCSCSSLWHTAYWGGLCCDCGVLIFVGLVYRIRGLCIVTFVCCCASLWGTVYGDLCVVTVLFRFASIWGTVYWGFVCCDCGMLLFVVLGSFILTGFCIVTVVCCCALVCGTV